MFINTIPHYQQSCNFRAKAASAVVTKNKYKILLSQDICSPNLAVKMPDTPEEREVLLEVLSKRLKLDKFFRYTNEKLRILSDLGRAATLAETNPTSEEYALLRADLLKRGNLVSVINTLNKKIKQEGARNKDSIDYFREIAEIESEYLGENKNQKGIKSKKIITVEQERKFWAQVIKHNINPDGNLSTKEIIAIVSSSDKDVQSISKSPAVKLSKDAAIQILKDDYEAYLKRNIDVYEENKRETAKNTLLSRDLVVKNNEKIFKIYPELKKQLPNIFKSVEAIYRFKLNKVASCQMYPLSKIWLIMDKIENLAKESIEKLNKYNQALELAQDESVAKAKKYEEGKLNSLKNEWLDGLTQAVQYEQMNRDIVKRKGLEAEYNYLTEENPQVVGQTSLVQELKEKYNGDINKAHWTEIFGAFLKT